MATTTQIVIVMEGGAVQSILANGDTVQVLVKDYDTDGMDDADKVIDNEGGEFNAIQGPDEIDAAVCAECFAQVERHEAAQR